MLQSATLTAGGVAAVGALLTGVAQVGRMIPATEPAVDAFISFAQLDKVSLDISGDVAEYRSSVIDLRVEQTPIA